MSRKLISLILSFCLLFTQTGFAQAAAVELNLSGYFARMASSLGASTFRPLHLRYLSYDPQANNFNLLLDKGDFLKGPSPKDDKEKFQQAAKELLNYFFIGISLPNSAFWVNLRPDSPDNIIDPELAQTDIGRTFLEADLKLKKDTANLTSPQTPEGREYWDKLYKKAAEIYGSENVTIPTLTRPWIVPDEIIIRESNDNAYIYKATLKVMLEEDYLKDSTTYSFKDSRSKALNEYSSQLIREFILPKLTKEVNSSKGYASLRQVYYSLILAQWFKTKFYGRSGTYSTLIDRHNLKGLTSQTPYSKNTYFNAYKQSFQQGEYNIKEPTYTPSGQVIRSYMSGGIMAQSLAPTFLSAGSSVVDKDYLVSVHIGLDGEFVDPLGSSPLKQSLPEHWDPSWEIPSSEAMRLAKEFIQEFKEDLTIKERAFFPDIEKDFISFLIAQEGSYQFIRPIVPAGIIRALYFESPEIAAVLIASMKTPTNHILWSSSFLAIETSLMDELINRAVKAYNSPSAVEIEGVEYKPLYGRFQLDGVFMCMPEREFKERISGLSTAAQRLIIGQAYEWYESGKDRWVLQKKEFKNVVAGLLQEKPELYFSLPERRRKWFDVRIALPDAIDSKPVQLSDVENDPILKEIKLKSPFQMGKIDEYLPIFENLLNDAYEDMLISGVQKGISQYSDEFGYFVKRGLYASALKAWFKILKGIKELKENKNPFVRKSALESKALFIFEIFTKESSRMWAEYISAQGFDGLQSQALGKGVGKIVVIRDPAIDSEKIRRLTKDDIVVVEDLMPDIELSGGIAGIITTQKSALLSHASARANALGLPCVNFEDGLDMLSYLEGEWVFIEAGSKEAILRKATQEEIKNRRRYARKVAKVDILRYDSSFERNDFITDYYPGVERVIGFKAANQLLLQSKDINASVPRSMALPFSFFLKVLDHNYNRNIKGEIERIYSNIDKTDLSDTERKLQKIRSLLKSLDFPWEIESEIKNKISEYFPSVSNLIIRTSTNAEDLPEYPGLGIGSYGSYICISEAPLSDIRRAFASVFKSAAFKERELYGIDHTEVLPAILIQEFIPADYAFGVHTIHPISQKNDQVLIEVVQGLGQGLRDYECSRGSPHQFVYDKVNNKVISFHRSDKKKKLIFAERHGFMDTIRADTDYSQDIFVNDPENIIVNRIVAISKEIEKEFGKPQDIEGVIKITDGIPKIYIVQSRSQKVENRGSSALVSSAIDSTVSSPAAVAQAIRDVETTLFSPADIITFRQCRIYRHGGLGVICKELIDNVITDGPRAGYYYKQKALKGYQLAQQRLGGLVIPFSIVDLWVQVKEENIISKTAIENAVILDKVKDYDLTDKIKCLAREGKIEDIKALIRQVFKIDHSIMRRGCYLPDPLLENFGILEDGRVVLVDPGFLVSDDIQDNQVTASDWWLRGRSHHLNNIFLNTLKELGLNNEQIHEIKMVYGEASGVYPMEFDDKYFAFFEPYIKDERYYARGEQEFREFYRSCPPGEAVPVLFAAASPAADSARPGSSPLAVEGKDLLSLVDRIEPLMAEGGFEEAAGTQIDIVYRAFDRDGNKLPFVIKVPRKGIIEIFKKNILPFAKDYMGGIIAPFTALEDNDATLLGKQYPLLILQRELFVFSRGQELPEKYTLPDGREINLQEKKNELLLGLVKRGIDYEDIIGGNEQYGLDLESGELYFFYFSFPKFEELDNLFHGYLTSIRYDLGWTYRESDYLKSLWATERNKFPVAGLRYEKQDTVGSGTASASLLTFGGKDESAGSPAGLPHYLVGGKLNLKYLQRIREIVNPDHAETTVLYLGSGGDISTPLFATDAKTFVLVDAYNLYPQGGARWPTSNDWDNYLGWKHSVGWVDYKVYIRNQSVYPYLRKELNELGIDSEDIEEIRDKDQPNVIKLNFKWGGRPRQVILIGSTHAEDVDAYAPYLQDCGGIDYYMVKAGGNLLPSNISREVFDRASPYEQEIVLQAKRAINKLAREFLRPGGFIILDSNQHGLPDKEILPKMFHEVTDQMLEDLEKEGAVFGYTFDRFKKQKGALILRKISSASAASSPASANPGPSEGDSAFVDFNGFRLHSRVPQSGIEIGDYARIASKIPRQDNVMEIGPSDRPCLSLLFLLKGAGEVTFLQPSQSDIHRTRSSDSTRQAVKEFFQINDLDAGYAERVNFVEERLEDLNDTKTYDVVVLMKVLTDPKLQADTFIDRLAALLNNGTKYLIASHTIAEDRLFGKRMKMLKRKLNSYGLHLREQEKLMVMLDYPDTVFIYSVEKKPSLLETVISKFTGTSLSKGSAVSNPAAGPPELSASPVKQGPPNIEYVDKGSGAFSDIAKVAQWYKDMLVDSFGEDYVDEEGNRLYRFLMSAARPTKENMQEVLGWVWDADYYLRLSKMSIPQMLKEYRRLKPSDFVHKQMGLGLLDIVSPYFNGHLYGRTEGDIVSFQDLEADKRLLKLMTDEYGAKYIEGFRKEAELSKKKMLFYHQWIYRHWDPGPKKRTHLVVDLKEIKNTSNVASSSADMAKADSATRGLFTPARWKYLDMIRQFVDPHGNKQRLLYIGSAGDIFTALGCSNAKEFIFVDRMSFKPTKNFSPEEENNLKARYLKEKNRLKLSTVPVLEELGCGAGFLLKWELEELKAQQVDIKEAAPGNHEISFYLPGEDKKRKIYYYEVDDAYPEALTNNIRQGIDICIIKAFTGSLSHETKDLVVDSLTEGGAIISDSVDAYFSAEWPMNYPEGLKEEPIEEIRAFEKKHQELFGYNKVVILRKQIPDTAEKKIASDPAAAGPARPGSSLLRPQERVKILLGENEGINRIYSIAFGDKPQDAQRYKDMMRNFLLMPFEPKDEMFSEIDALSNSEKIALAKQAIAKDPHINQKGLSLEELLFINQPNNEETARYILHSSLLSRRIWQFAGSDRDFALFVPYLEDDAEHLENALQDWKEVYLILWAAKILYEEKNTAAASPLKQNHDDLGGIDMRRLARNTVIETGKSVEPDRFSPEIESKELQEIQRLIQAGIIPSLKRLEECRTSCGAEALLACVADILRMEEGRAQATDPALKTLLAAVENKD